MFLEDDATEVALVDAGIEEALDEGVDPADPATAVVAGLRTDGPARVDDEEVEDEAGALLLLVFSLLVVLGPPGGSAGFATRAGISIRGIGIF